MGKIQLIDAETLYYKPLEHPKMLIDGVLSDGLAIMAGDSKIGKSWMVLWMCLQISKGEPVWGLPTRKTDVVYLALEDREWRVQQRMLNISRHLAYSLINDRYIPGIKIGNAYRVPKVNVINYALSAGNSGPAA